MTQMLQGLPRSLPEVQGIGSAAILRFVEAAEQEGHELHSLMIVRHGAVVAEGWWHPYAPELPHMLYSLSKSFTATAAGFAGAAGKLSLDDAVVSFFPEDLPTEVSEPLAAMRVRDLLAMATGHQDEIGFAMQENSDGNWARAFLAQPVPHIPGTHFLYDSAGGKAEVICVRR